MPRKTFACTFGHRFFPDEAETLNFRCDKDASPLVGEPEHVAPPPADPAEVAAVFDTGDGEEPTKPR